MRSPKPERRALPRTLPKSSNTTTVNKRNVAQLPAYSNHRITTPSLTLFDRFLSSRIARPLLTYHLISAETLYTARNHHIEELDQYFDNVLIHIENASNHTPTPDQKQALLTSLDLFGIKLNTIRHLDPTFSERAYIKDRAHKFRDPKAKFDWIIKLSETIAPKPSNSQTTLEILPKKQATLLKQLVITIILENIDLPNTATSLTAEALNDLGKRLAIIEQMQSSGVTLDLQEQQVKLLQARVFLHNRLKQLAQELPTTNINSQFAQLRTEAMSYLAQVAAFHSIEQKNNDSNNPNYVTGILKEALSRLSPQEQEKILQNLSYEEIKCLIVSKHLPPINAIQGNPRQLDLDKLDQCIAKEIDRRQSDFVADEFAKADTENHLLSTFSTRINRAHQPETFREDCLNAITTQLKQKISGLKQPNAISDTDTLQDLRDHITFALNTSRQDDALTLTSDQWTRYQNGLIREALITLPSEDLKLLLENTSFNELWSLATKLPSKTLLPDSSPQDRMKNLDSIINSTIQQHPNPMLTIKFGAIAKRLKKSSETSMKPLTLAELRSIATADLARFPEANDIDAEGKTFPKAKYLNAMVKEALACLSNPKQRQRILGNLTDKELQTLIDAEYLLPIPTVKGGTRQLAIDTLDQEIAACISAQSGSSPTLLRFSTTISDIHNTKTVDMAEAAVDRSAENLLNTLEEALADLQSKKPLDTALLLQRLRSQATTALNTLLMEDALRLNTSQWRDLQDSLILTALNRLNTLGRLRDIDFLTSELGQLPHNTDYRKFPINNALQITFNSINKNLRFKTNPKTQENDATFISDSITSALVNLANAPVVPSRPLVSLRNDAKAFLVVLATARGIDLPQEESKRDLYASGVLKEALASLPQSQRERILKAASFSELRDLVKAEHFLSIQAEQGSARQLALDTLDREIADTIELRSESDGASLIEVDYDNALRDFSPDTPLELGITKLLSTLSGIVSDLKHLDSIDTTALFEDLRNQATVALNGYLMDEAKAASPYEWKIYQNRFIREAISRLSESDLAYLISRLSKKQLSELLDDTDVQLNTLFPITETQSAKIKKLDALIYAEIADAISFRDQFINAITQLSNPPQAATNTIEDDLEQVEAEELAAYRNKISLLVTIFESYKALQAYDQRIGTAFSTSEKVTAQRNKLTALLLPPSNLLVELKIAIIKTTDDINGDERKFKGSKRILQRIYDTFAPGSKEAESLNRLT